MTTNINIKFTSNYMNKKINKIITNNYVYTIKYYLNEIENIFILSVKNMTKEELSNTYKIKLMIDMYTFINKEIIHNIKYTEFNNTIVYKNNDLRETLQEKLPDKLNDLFCSIDLQIHIYGRHLCDAISVTTNKLCNKKYVNGTSMCTIHNNYYNSRKNIILMYLYNDIADIVINYMK